MKKSIFYIAATFLLLSIAPLQVNATTNPEPLFVALTRAAEPTKAEKLNARVYEIESMDKSNLSRAEKKALRKELRSIKHELQAGSGGVYLSTGAIILIAVLLIILL